MRHAGGEGTGGDAYRAGAVDFAAADPAQVREAAAEQGADAIAGAQHLHLYLAERGEDAGAGGETCGWGGQIRIRCGSDGKLAGLGRMDVVPEQISRLRRGAESDGAAGGVV